MTMFQTILLPIDGSDETFASVGYGFELANQYDATVHAFYVIDGQKGGAEFRDTEQQRLQKKGRGALTEIEHRGIKRDIAVTTAISEGVPAKEIAQYIDNNGIDLTVMSSHGRSGVSRFVHGSVTERVLRLTNCPVLVVDR